MHTRVQSVTQVFVEQPNPTVFTPRLTATPAKIDRKTTLPIQPYTENDYLHLLENTSGIVDDDCEEHLFVKTVRFVLDNHFKVLLSREGRPGEWTLSHTEMADRCISSGDLMFDAQNKLRMVSNIQTGFMPTITSLQFLMIVLIKNNKIALADEIIFRLYYDKAKVSHVKISLTNLKAELSGFAFYKRYDDANHPNNSEPATLTATRQTANPFVTPQLPARTLNGTSATAALPNLSMFSMPNSNIGFETNGFVARLLPQHAARATTAPQQRVSIQQLSVIVPPRHPIPGTLLASALAARTVQMPPQQPTFIRSVITALDSESASASSSRRTAFHAPERKGDDEVNKRPKL
jgi:hypothetical protein